MRWHIGIFGKRKALFFGLVFLALLCVFMMFHDVQGDAGGQWSVDGKGQRSDVGSRRSEVGKGQRSEVGSRRSEVGKGLKATEYQLTVMTYNVGTLHGTKVAFREIVNAVEEGGVPDLLLLQEIPNEEMVVGKDSGRWSVVRCQGFRERAVSGGRVNGC